LWNKSKELLFVYINYTLELLTTRILFITSTFNEDDDFVNKIVSVTNYAHFFSYHNHKHTWNKYEFYPPHYW